VVQCFTNNTTIDNGDGLIAVNPGKTSAGTFALWTGIYSPGEGTLAVQLSGSLP